MHLYRTCRLLFVLVNLSSFMTRWLPAALVLALAAGSLPDAPLAQPDPSSMESASPWRFAVLGQAGPPFTLNRMSEALRRFEATPSGTSSDWSLGLTLTHSTKLSNVVTWETELGMRRGIGKFVSEPFLANGQEQRYAIATEYTAFELGSYLTLSPVDRLTLGGGLQLAFHPASDASLTLQRTGMTDTTLASGSVLLSNRLQLRVPFFLQTPFVEYARWQVALHAGMIADIDQLGKVYLAQSVAARAGLTFRLLPGTPLPPKVEQDSVSSPPPPSASVRFTVHDVDLDSTEVVRIDTMIVRTIPVPQTIVLDTSLLSSWLQADRPLTALDVLQSWVSVIGKRLASSSTSLTLEVSPEAGSDAHASRMVETIRHHWIRNYAVDPSRLRIIPSSKRPGLPTVTLRPSEPSLLLPIRRSELVHSGVLEGLGIRRAITSSTTIRQWTVTVYDGNRIVATFSSADHSSVDDLPPIRLPAREHTELTVTLVVTDDHGQQSTASDTLKVLTLPVDLVKRTTQTVVTLWNMPVPEGQNWSFERSALKELTERLTSRSRVQLTCFVPEASKVFASVLQQIVDGARARGVSLEKIEAIPAPVSTILVPPAMKEMLSRAVIVTVFEPPK